MRCLWLLCVLVSAVVSAPAEDNAQGKKWAVLVAGSSDWWNYGDQADVSHAYQILHRQGIPDENIIVFMYDDIATNDQNPSPGTIINRPNGTDVYKGVKKDYVKDNVNPKNFLAVITGDKEAANGKVLKSGPDDHVFIYFADHGGPNILAFPDDVLYADYLIKALKTMHEKKMYKKVLLYIEACESGSMVAGKLPNNIDIVAVTAANPTEVAWRTYCKNSPYPCLGNDFGVAWMEKADKDDGSVLVKETVNDFYKAQVKQCSKGEEGNSHPKLYGQKKLAKDLYVDFIGVGTKTADTRVREIAPTYQGKKVSIRDSYLNYINQRIEMANDKKELQEFRAQKSLLIEGRKMIDELFSNIMSQVEDTDDEMNNRSVLYMEEMPCYRTLVENFKQQCVNINKNTYALVHLEKLANLCARDNFSPQQVLNIFSTECTQQHRQLNRVH